jgi:hypothetical protein
MFAQPDEYITLVFSLIAIVFWYRLRTRVEMSQEIGDGVETAEHSVTCASASVP